MEKFIVTIARTYGSGGKDIGKEIAKKLGIGYYGREILEMASDNADSNDYNSGESIEYSFNVSNELFQAQSKAILEVAQKESCVIVGRCGDYVLRNMEHVVNIYIYSTPRECLRRVMKMYSLNPDEARRLIHSMNKSRNDYYEHYTGRKRDDVTNYDLCINASVGQEKCIRVILDYIKIVLE